MKFKVGDKVKVKALGDIILAGKPTFANIVSFGAKDFIISDMSKFCGKEFFVNRITTRGYELISMDSEYKDVWCWRWTDEMLEKAEVKVDKPKDDPVSHPSHYCQEGSMECIDEMIAVFGAEAVMHFCLLNVWKYRKRALFKNGQEDMKKSDFYMKKWVELNNAR